MAFEAIAEADLLALISNAVSEGRTIDYKRELPGNSDGEKKEFLADVSSFANTSGGDLIFGLSCTAFRLNRLPDSHNMTFFRSNKIPCY